MTVSFQSAIWRINRWTNALCCVQQ